MDLMVMLMGKVTRATGRAPAVVLIEERSSVCLKQVRLRERLRVRLGTTRFDEQLAAGASPESNSILALHAARLYGPTERRRLAMGLRTVVRAARRPRRTPVPIEREGVRLALDQLEEVVARLESAGPMDVSSIARVRCLLEDGAGPLYRRSTPGRLQRELAAVLGPADPAQA
jgi:hypothetical protein